MNVKHMLTPQKLKKTQKQSVGGPEALLGMTMDACELWAVPAMLLA